MGLKADKSPGPGNLPSRMLKEVARDILHALAVTFQKCIGSGACSYGSEDGKCNPKREGEEDGG